MSLPLYADVHVDGRVIRALRSRGVDILRAQDDGSSRFDDPQLLDRSAELQRVVVTYDDDFLKEAVRRQQTGGRFAGLVFGSPARLNLGDLVDQLQVVAECLSSEEIADRIVYVRL